MTEPENGRLNPRIISDATYRAGIIRRALELRSDLASDRREELDARLHKALNLPVFLKVDEVPLDTLANALTAAADNDPSILGSLVLPLWRQSQPLLVRSVCFFLRDESEQERSRLHRLTGFPSEWTDPELQETLAAFAQTGADYTAEDVETVLIALDLADYEATLSAPIYIRGEWGRFLEPWQSLDEFESAWDEIGDFIAALDALGQDRLRQRMAGREALELSLSNLKAAYSEKLGFFGIPASSWSADRAPLREAAEYATEVDALSTQIDAYSVLETQPVSTMEERRRLRERMAVMEDAILQRAQRISGLIGPGAGVADDLSRGDAGAVAAPATEPAVSRDEAAEAPAPVTQSPEPAEAAVVPEVSAAVAEAPVEAAAQDEDSGESHAVGNGYSVVVEETILVPASAFDADGAMDPGQPERSQNAAMDPDSVGG